MRKKTIERVTDNNTKINISNNFYKDTLKIKHIYLNKRQKVIVRYKADLNPIKIEN